MARNKLVAVTGNAGSGKSTVCRILKEKGLTVIDLDVLSREAVEPGNPSLAEISAIFGKEAVNPDGSLDRAFLRDVIIRNPEKRKKLEAVLHPRIMDMMNTRVKEAFGRGENIVVVEAPLLFEAGLEAFFDLVVVVVCDPEERIRRLSVRDGVSLERAAALISIQIPDEVKAGRAGYTVLNSGEYADLHEEAERLYNYLKCLILDNQTRRL